MQKQDPNSPENQEALSILHETFLSDTEEPMNKIDKIVELTKEWYKLIGRDHHKDRDCHFYIETKFSYGGEPTYWVRHHGYVIDEVEEEYPTYDKALDGLIQLLEYIIKAEKEQEVFVDDSW
jgi:hypothetical protein